MSVKISEGDWIWHGQHNLYPRRLARDRVSEQMRRRDCLRNHSGFAAGSFDRHSSQTQNPEVELLIHPVKRTEVHPTRPQDQLPTSSLQNTLFTLSNNIPVTGHCQHQALCLLPNGFLFLGLRRAVSHLSLGIPDLSATPSHGHQKKRAQALRMVGLGRFELPTSPLSGVRSNQLSYRPNFARTLNP